MLTIFIYRHQIQMSTNEKVLTTKKDLQRLTVVVRHGDKQQKLQVERLTSDFQKVVEIYSACQQVRLIDSSLINMRLTHCVLFSILMPVTVANCGKIEGDPFDKCFTAG